MTVADLLIAVKILLITQMVVTLIIIVGLIILSVLLYRWGLKLKEEEQ